MNPKEFIARRAARELHDGDVVNLGIGLPTMVANYLREDQDVTFQSENGIMGLGPAATPGEEDYTLTNAGAQPVTIVPGAMFFDSATSFGIIRGGHVDATILGALEVSQNGDIASWKAEIAPDISVEDVKKATEADIIVAENLKVIEL